MGIIAAGFILGITVSLHCAGMCGPLVLVLNSERQNLGKVLLKNFLYGLGKTITYFALGMVIGSIGFGVHIAGMQQYLSLATGIILLIVVLMKAMKIEPKIVFFEEINSKIKRGITLLIVRNNIKGALVFGLLNGLLPCGVLYIALSVALNSGTPLNSGLYMASFGFGTLVMLFAIALGGNFINRSFRKYTPLVSRALSVIVALMLIIRGLNIGVQYLSPKVVSNNDGDKLECCKPSDRIKN